MTDITSQLRLFNNHDAKTISGRMEVERDGSVQSVLVVETDLELNGLKPSYDDQAVRRLAADVAEALGDQFNRGDIVPRRSAARA